MHRFARSVVAALVLVAFLSVAANAAVDRRPVDRSPANCAWAEISVYPLEESDPGPGIDDVPAFADLSDSHREAIDRARSRSNRTSRIDPSLVAGLPSPIRIGDTRYRVSTRTWNCPLVRGTPHQFNAVVLPLFTIYHAFSPLYLPGVAVLGIVLVYRRVDEWLRFD